MIPAISMIIDPSQATYGIIFGAILSAVVHGVFYIIYRYKIPDIRMLSSTILSACIILESAIFKISIELLKGAGMYLIMSTSTLALFSFAVIKMHVISQEMEAKSA
jgi:hypothetical protein